MPPIIVLDAAQTKTKPLAEKPTAEAHLHGNAAAVASAGDPTSGPASLTLNALSQANAGAAALPQVLMNNSKLDEISTHEVC